MKFYQRVCLIVAHEGLSGLFQRILHKLSLNDRRHVFSNSKAKDKSKIQEEYDQSIKDFNEKALKMGYGDLRKYYWYHTIDLGNGLITPGTYDYRSSLPLYKFPIDMKGLNVLDIGSATGFFAFEFERRGANVISVELPSIADWDMPLGEDRERTLKELMSFHEVNTVEELHHFHLDGPFEFCRKVLNSKVKRCYSKISDLSAQKLGMDAFDLVFIGDMLLHTFSPLQALVSVAPLCRDTLVITYGLSDIEDFRPVMQYTGGETRGGDNRTWWIPNRLCLEQMLKRLGFKNVSLVGKNTGIAKPYGWSYDTSIIHATK